MSQTRLFDIHPSSEATAPSIPPSNLLPIQILLLGHRIARRRVLGTAADSRPPMPKPYGVTTRFRLRIELPVDGLAASRDSL